MLHCCCRIPESALGEYNYYMDTSKLRITVSNMKNANSRAELERIKTTILENLSKLPAAPSAPFEARPPPLATVRHRRVLWLYSVPVSSDLRSFVTSTSDGTGTSACQH